MAVVVHRALRLVQAAVAVAAAQRARARRSRLNHHHLLVVEIRSPTEETKPPVAVAPSEEGPPLADKRIQRLLTRSGLDRYPRHHRETMVSWTEVSQPSSFHSPRPSRCRTACWLRRQSTLPAPIALRRRSQLRSIPVVRLHLDSRLGTATTKQASSNREILAVADLLLLRLSHSRVPPQAATSIAHRLTKRPAK